MQFGRRNNIEIMKIFSKIQFGRRNKVEIPLNISKAQFGRRNSIEISINHKNDNLDSEIILKFQRISRNTIWTPKLYCN